MAGIDTTTMGSTDTDGGAFAVGFKEVAEDATDLSGGEAEPALDKLAAGALAAADGEDAATEMELRAV
jgi:hypothetical protein